MVIVIIRFLIAEFSRCAKTLNTTFILRLQSSLIYWLYVSALLSLLISIMKNLM